MCHCLVPSTDIIFTHFSVVLHVSHSISCACLPKHQGQSRVTLQIKVPSSQWHKADPLTIFCDIWWRQSFSEPPATLFFNFSPPFSQYAAYAVPFPLFCPFICPQKRAVFSSFPCLFFQPSFGKLGGQWPALLSSVLETFSHPCARFWTIFCIFCFP